MTLTGLRNTIKHYITEGDPETARNYILKYGERFPEFDTKKELRKIERIMKKHEKKD